MQEEGVCVCCCWRRPFSFSLPLKNILTKAVFCSACHYAKSFSLEDNGCSQRKIYMGSPECNELPHSSCLGLGVVTCKWFEIRTECGKMRSYRIPPLAFFFFFFCGKSFSILPGLSLFLRHLIRYGEQRFPPDRFCE